jgi:hypothetical protein
MTLDRTSSAALISSTMLYEPQDAATLCRRVAPRSVAALQAHRAFGAALLRRGTLLTGLVGECAGAHPRGRIAHGRNPLEYWPAEHQQPRRLRMPHRLGSSCPAGIGKFLCGKMPAGMPSHTPSLACFNELAIEACSSRKRAQKCSGSSATSTKPRSRRLRSRRRSRPHRRSPRQVGQSGE